MGKRVKLSDWTVDYGDGPRPCRVPHAWRQDVDVRWEGPAVYRTQVEVPDEPCWLVFHGVSYHARVCIRSAELGTLLGPDPPVGANIQTDSDLMEVISLTSIHKAIDLNRYEFSTAHDGIWDAFSVPLKDFCGQKVEIAVVVIKNGGPTFPVKEVLSGFLPYVFNTFGGIYQEVEIVEEADLPLPLREAEGEGAGGEGRSSGKASSIAHRSSRSPRVRVDGTKLVVDGKPFYLRAPLTWGWYPELGHTNPAEAEIRREVKLARDMGFNTMKFCLWVPPHRYFEILNEEGMFAWLELPLWDPTPDPEKQEAMFAEMERITRQYAHHDNIIVWTCGCELSSNTTAEFRERLYKMVKEITGCPLVKDNSGGSEMYGGDLREFGDFYDFHPYCDLPFYPQVLDSLLIGPRKRMPILLGEFNDVDVFRDLARLRKERPYWTSTDPALNDQGLRWEPPVLPRVLEESPLAKKSPRHDDQLCQSWFKACFVRSRVQSSVRERGFAGYVVTGWRDTPISAAGLIDDWGKPRDKLPLLAYDGDTGVFLVPFRKPPWIDGGNRPGWTDPYNYFEGPITMQVGLHSARSQTCDVQWEVCKLRLVKGERPLPTVAAGAFRARIQSLEPTAPGLVEWNPDGPGHYSMFVRLGRSEAGGFNIHVFPKPTDLTCQRWRFQGPKDLVQGFPFGVGPNYCTIGFSDLLLDTLEEGHRACLFLTDSGTRPAPYWRESAFECQLGSSGRYWAGAPEDRLPLAWFTDTWEVQLPVSPDRAIDVDALYSHLPKKSEIKVLINRIDTRTYKEAPIMVEVRCGKGRMLATTLRPYGGLGCQPYGVMNNPAGAALLESMIQYLENEE